MNKKKSTLLERMAEQSVPMSELYEARKDANLAPLVELIIASDQIAAKAQESWEFKSLAQIGSEHFIWDYDGSYYLNYNGPRNPNFDNDGKIEKWLKRTVEKFSSNICLWVCYEEEGVLLFVQDGMGKYRVARNGDAAYDFVRRLCTEESLFDLRFTKPPSWAEELFIWYENYEVYQSHYNVGSDEVIRKLTSDAVIHETRRRMEAILGLPYDSALLDDQNRVPICEQKPMGARERNTLLIIIAALAKEARIDLSKPSKAGAFIANLTEIIGAPVDHSTIEQKIKLIANALESRAKP